MTFCILKCKHQSIRRGLTCRTVPWLHFFKGKETGVKAFASLKRARFTEASPRMLDLADP